MTIKSDAGIGVLLPTGELRLVSSTAAAVREIERLTGRNDLAVKNGQVVSKTTILGVLLPMEQAMEVMN